jgi:hypothetical protein
MECESQRIVWCVREGFGRGPRDQLDTGVRTENAEIQSGSNFGRIDRPDDFDHGVVSRVGSLSKQRPSSASEVIRPQ